MEKSMYPFDVPSLLILTASLIAVELVFFALILWRRGLFHWSSAGFWAWSSFLLYFVIAPLAMSGDQKAVYETQIRLSVAGGMDRGLWVLALAFAGIAAFFTVYLRTTFKPVTWGLPPGPLRLTPPALLVLFVLFLFGIYSLVVFRAGLVATSGEKIIEAGRFVGNITGYQNVGYMFLFVPVILLLFSRDKVLWVSGVILAFLFVTLSLPHAWSRYATVSFLLSVSMVGTTRSRKRLPPFAWLAGLLLLAMVFQLRGHAEWKYSNILDETVRLVGEIPQESRRMLSSTDTAMIMTWYVDSYFYDTWVGFDFALPPLNYVLTGWIPSRIFSNKYFIIDWLNARRGYVYPAILDRFLFGSKPTLLGSLYAHGGLLGVLIGAGLAGFLSRRLDGMLAKDTSNLVKSVAIAWLGALWMVWGSSSTWGMMAIGAIAIPGLAVWLFLPKVSSRLKSKSQPIEINSERMYSLER